MRWRRSSRAFGGLRIGSSSGGMASEAERFGDVAIDHGAALFIIKTVAAVLDELAATLMQLARGWSSRQNEHLPSEPSGRIAAMGTALGSASEPAFTIREAAAVSTKTASAIRSMVDRGELNAISFGRRGKPRRIPRSALIRAGIFREEGSLPTALKSFQQQLALFQNRLDGELEGRLSQLELFQSQADDRVDRRLDEFATQLSECQDQIKSLQRQLEGALSPPAASHLRIVSS